jgi:hypothetical protein
MSVSFDRVEEASRRNGLTMLKPSTSPSLTQRSISSATVSGVPTLVAPRPPTMKYQLIKHFQTNHIMSDNSPMICCASVFFVHFPPLTSGAVLIKFLIYPWIALLLTYLSSSSSP